MKHFACGVSLGIFYIKTANISHMDMDKMDTASSFFFIQNQTNFDNVKWILENLFNEYRTSFELLKQMLPLFRRSKINSHQMRMFELELVSVDNNVTQLDQHYRKFACQECLCLKRNNIGLLKHKRLIKAESLISLYQQCSSQTHYCIDHPSTDNYQCFEMNAHTEVNCHQQEVSSNYELPNYELATTFDGQQSSNNRLCLSPIDYYLSSGDSTDLFDYLILDDNVNMVNELTSQHAINVENTSAACIKQPNSSCIQTKSQTQSSILIPNPVEIDSQSQNCEPQQSTVNKVAINKTTERSIRSTKNGQLKNTRTAANSKQSTKSVNGNVNKKEKRQNESRVWYRCAWEGCSFGSYYNGVVKRHSFKRHSGKIRIDKSPNSSMHRFKCDWPGCEVSLVAYHKLVEHKRKHTGEKPFRCKWKSCNYATARLYSMIIHERTHKLDPFIE